MVYYTKSRRSNVIKQISEKIVKIRIVIVAFLVVSSLAYFWQITSLSVRGFKIKDLENSIQQLKKDNQKLELEATDKEAMLNVEEKVKGLGLVAVEKVDYLTVVSPVVAMR